MEDINKNNQNVNVEKIIKNLIVEFTDALEIPQEFQTSGPTNSINHLLSSFNVNDDTSSEILEQVLHDSESFRSIPIQDIQSQSATSSTELKEKSSKSSAASFILRLLGRKRNQTSITTLTSIPSVNSSTDNQSLDLKSAEEEIKQLENQGPAGILHLSPLSHVINRKIHVWTSSMNLYHDVGRDNSSESLNIQYHSSPDDSIPGHWTLLNNQEPTVLSIDLNNCLFNAISAQTGVKPSELREATIEYMKQKIRSLAHRIHVLAREKQCGRIVLMIGGARYTGTTDEDAKKILDASQLGRCHGQHIHGHPRGHTSDPTATGQTGSAERYSQNGGIKSAFLNVEDQNRVGNQALRTPAAQQAMAELNQGGESRAINIPASEILDLPIGAEFIDGKIVRKAEIRELVLVLRHHAGHANDPNYDVFVHTFYPKLGNTVPEPPKVEGEEKVDVDKVPKGENSQGEVNQGEAKKEVQEEVIKKEEVKEDGQKNT